MSIHRQTPHIGLHLYSSGDPANLRDQYNISMRILDKQFHLLYKQFQQISAIDIEELKERVSAAEERIASLEDWQTKHQQEYIELEARITQIEGDITAINTTLVQMQAEIDDLEVRVSACERRLDDYDTRLAEIDENLKQALSDIDTLEQRCAALETRCTTLEVQVQQLQSDVDALQERTAALETKVTEIDGRLTTAESDIDDIESSTIEGSAYITVTDVVETGKIHQRTVALDDELITRIETLERIYPAMVNNLNEVYYSTPRNLWTADGENYWGVKDNLTIEIPDADRYSMLCCIIYAETATGYENLACRPLGYTSVNTATFRLFGLQNVHNDGESAHTEFYSIIGTRTANNQFTIDLDRTYGLCVFEDTNTFQHRSLVVSRVIGLAPWQGAYNWESME